MNKHWIIFTDPRSKWCSNQVMPEKDLIVELEVYGKGLHERVFWNKMTYYRKYKDWRYLGPLELLALQAD